MRDVWLSGGCNFKVAELGHLEQGLAFLCVFGGEGVSGVREGERFVSIVSPVVSAL